MSFLHAACLCYIVNIMVADGLVTQGARTSAVIILSMLSEETDTERPEIVHVFVCE